MPWLYGAGKEKTPAGVSPGPSFGCVAAAVEVVDLNRYYTTTGCSVKAVVYHSR